MKEKDVIRPYMEETAVKWWYKIQDNKFTGKKPFDVIGIDFDERPIALEFKIHKTMANWSYSKVIPFQKESLLNFADAGGVALVVLCLRVRLSETQKKQLNAPNKLVSMAKVWQIRDFIEASKEKTFDIKQFYKENLANVRLP